MGSRFVPLIMMIQPAVVRLVLRLTGACRGGRRGHECDIERAVTAERRPLTAAERDTQMVMIGMSQRTRVVLSEVYSLTARKRDRVPFAGDYSGQCNECVV